MARSVGRKPRALVLTDRVKTVLVRLHLMENLPLAVDVETLVVAEVEAALECRFPDDVLALFGSNADGLREDHGIDLTQVVENTRHAHERGCPKNLVAIGRQPDGLAFYCVESAPLTD